MLTLNYLTPVDQGLLADRIKAVKATVTYETVDGKEFQVTRLHFYFVECIGLFTNPEGFFEKEYVVT